MNQRVDIKGMRFGRLVVQEYVGDRMWRCICDCGGTKLAPYSSLSRGATTSCGCRNSEVAAQRMTKHGDTNSTTYKIWCGMKSRCYTESASGYKYYGGKGIGVCDRWRNSYEAFKADMGECPVGYSLERRDNGKDYTPDNCVWIPKGDQAKNTSRVLRFEGKTVQQWADELGMPYRSVLWRIHNWKSVHKR